MDISIKLSLLITLPATHRCIRSSASLEYFKYSQHSKLLGENYFKPRIITLFSYNGGEFVGLTHFISTHGISHHTSPPHTPEHNGVAERKHRHIVETNLALFTHVGMPNTYWSYSLSAAVYLINCMSTLVLSNKSPYVVLFHEDLNYLKLHIFGCLCYPWLRPYSQNKPSPRSTPCIFLGYSLIQSAYLYLNVYVARVYVSRHVQFRDSEFPFLRLTVSSPSSSTSHTYEPTI